MHSCGITLAWKHLLGFTRVGWKVHRLTKKELCNSNETWHVLNSTFPDTNCIVSFQINPHWISNSGLWKVVLETFQNSLENRRRESCFTRTMLLHTSLWLQRLLCLNYRNASSRGAYGHDPFEVFLKSIESDLIPQQQQILQRHYLYYTCR